MPIRRRSAASAGPMFGNCSSVLQSAALAALGALMTTALHQHVVADETDREPLELEVDVAERHDDGLEVGVLGDQLDAGPRAPEALDRDVVAEPRDDDLAVLR